MTQQALATNPFKLSVEVALEKLRARSILPIIADALPQQPAAEGADASPLVSSWVCHVCGNPNHLSRRHCFMQVCAAPRGFPGPYRDAVRQLPPPMDAAVAARKREEKEDAGDGQAASTGSAGKGKNTSSTMAGTARGSATSANRSLGSSSKGGGGGGSLHSRVPPPVLPFMPAGHPPMYGAPTAIGSTPYGSSAAGVGMGPITTPQWMMQSPLQPTAAMPVMAQGPDGGMYLVMPQMMGFPSQAAMMQHQQQHSFVSPGQPAMMQHPAMMPMFFQAPAGMTGPNNVGHPPPHFFAGFHHQGAPQQPHLQPAGPGAGGR